MIFDISITTEEGAVKLSEYKNNLEGLLKAIPLFEIEDVEFNIDKEFKTIDYSLCELTDLYEFYDLMSNWDDWDQRVLLSYIVEDCLEVQNITAETLYYIMDIYWGDYESDYDAALTYLREYMGMSIMQAEYVLTVAKPEDIIEREMVCFNGKYFIE